MNPRASAPRSAANWASSKFVMPQIFILNMSKIPAATGRPIGYPYPQVHRASRARRIIIREPWPALTFRLAHKLPEFRAWVPRSHQRFPDEKTLNSRGFQAFNIRPGFEARSDHQGYLRGGQGGQFQGPVRIHLKGGQVPGIDADDPGPNAKRRGHFLPGVDLHQGLQAQG